MGAQTSAHSKTQIVAVLEMPGVKHITCNVFLLTNSGETLAAGAAREQKTIRLNKQ